MGAEGPWQLWLFVLGWPAVWAVLALSLPRRWPGAVRFAAWVGWGGTLSGLAWMALRPPPPLSVWHPEGGAGGEALAFALRADPLGLALAAVCGGLGLLVQIVEGGAAERARGALVPLLGVLLALLAGNLLTYSMGIFLWEVSVAVMLWASGEGNLRRMRGFPGSLGLLLILLATAPASTALAFGKEDWPGWVRAGAALAGLWTAGGYPAVGPAESAAALPRGLRSLVWTLQPALGLALVGRVWAVGPVPGASALVPLLLLSALFAACWADGEANLARLAATRAAFLGLGMCVVPDAAGALPWAVLGFGLGFFCLDVGSSGSLLAAGWGRALGLLSLAGVPLTPAFLWAVAGGSSEVFLWWLGLGNALALAPHVWEGPSPAWQLPRPRWREGGACAALAGMGALALALGPGAGWSGEAKALASALGGAVGAVVLAWLRREAALVERGARGAARAVDPLAWVRGGGRLGREAGSSLRWLLGLWEGRAALLARR
ncbi:MAG: hypothetical protein ACP5UM_04010 [Anaerolineae bacterium]